MQKFWRGWPSFPFIFILPALQFTFTTIIAGLGWTHPMARPVIIITIIFTVQRTRRKYRCRLLSTSSVSRARKLLSIVVADSWIIRSGYARRFDKSCPTKTVECRLVAITLFTTRRNASNVQWDANHQRHWKRTIQIRFKYNLSFPFSSFYEFQSIASATRIVNFVTEDLYSLNVLRYYVFRNNII